MTVIAIVVSGMVYAKGKLYIVNNICYQNVDIVYSFVTDPTMLLIELL